MRELEPQTLAKPKSLEQLHSLEGRLQTHIGRQRLKVDSIRAHQPQTPLERINFGNRLLVADITEATIGNWLKPRLAFVTSDVNKGTLDLAERYEQEKSDVQAALTDLEKRDIKQPPLLKLLLKQSSNHIRKSLMK